MFLYKNSLSVAVKIITNDYILNFSFVRALESVSREHGAVPKDSQPLVSPSKLIRHLYLCDSVTQIHHDSRFCLTDAKILYCKTVETILRLSS